ncbi:CopG family ribbon-helix-helix protein [Tianweitania sp. BSSL-BM11]|uniref:CopG family ribbon-helix-helix protein n=1 Tax=Tianweitania aestuarii TaxID=2814886 RepID=A0ABS5RZJ6_9HYPH|nr:CopG family ribbon-helix-helix protein [Tianweitania aestuarii]MBS9721077.1 CopG family ribbon-helix-helix protein [Tianweitania aestuarii]
MASSETMTIRVPSETKEKLDRIAAHTRRSKSFLAGEAIAAYVERELQVIDGVAYALDDAKAGRVVSHEQAIAEMRQLLGKAKQGHDAGE